MSGQSEFDVIPPLRAVVPESTIVAASLATYSAYRQYSLRAGANSFIPNDRLAAELLPTLATLLDTDMS